MRSLLISASILIIGILAALPFRKNAQPTPVSKLETSKVEIQYQSPLQEIDGDVEQDINIADIHATSNLPSASRGNEPVAPMPALPTSRRPFADQLVDLTPIVAQPQADSISTRPPQSDWAMNTPLDFQPAPIPNDAPAIDPPTTTHPDRESTFQLPTSLVDQLTPKTMQLQHAALKESSESAKEPPSSVEPTEPRKRFFIYEPAN